MRAKTTLVVMGIAVFLCALTIVAVQIMSTVGQADRKTGAALQSPAPSRTPGPTLAPTPTLPPAEQLLADLSVLGGEAGLEDGAVAVRWNIGDAFTDEGARRRAKVEAAGFLRKIAESGIDYTGVWLSGWLPLVDVYGVETNTEVVRLYYSRETLGKIDWRNFDKDNTWLIADEGEVHRLMR